MLSVGGREYTKLVVDDRSEPVVRQCFNVLECLEDAKAWDTIMHGQIRSLN